MKAMIILLTAPMMLFFTFGVFSTAEYCMETGAPVPWTTLAGTIAIDIAWCISASRCSRKSLNRALRQYERFINKLFSNHFK
jgi:hypothetical protein